MTAPVLHVAVDWAVAQAALVVVQPVEQLIVRERAPRRLDQRTQQPEFQGRQVQRLAVPARLISLGVEYQLARRGQSVWRVPRQAEQANRVTLFKVLGGGWQDEGDVGRAATG